MTRDDDHDAALKQEADRAVDVGLTFTEREADRNAELGHDDSAPTSCQACLGRRWVDDENWFPEHEGERSRGRVPGSGRIPCGSCNLGGWDAP